jgi:hypothetical protein
MKTEPTSLFMELGPDPKITSNVTNHSIIIASKATNCRIYCLKEYKKNIADAFKEVMAYEMLRLVNAQQPFAELATTEQITLIDPKKQSQIIKKKARICLFRRGKSRRFP